MNWMHTSVLWNALLDGLHVRDIGDCARHAGLVSQKMEDVAECSAGVATDSIGGQLHRWNLAQTYIVVRQVTTCMGAHSHFFWLLANRDGQVDSGQNRSLCLCCVF